MAAWLATLYQSVCQALLPAGVATGDVPGLVIAAVKVGVTVSWQMPLKLTALEVFPATSVTVIVGDDNPSRR